MFRSITMLLLGASMLVISGGPMEAMYPPLQTAVYPVLEPAERASYSYNWAGYAATDAQEYTSVSGTWVVPTVSDESWGANATWVGIGGVASDDLIQAGTQAIVGPSGDVTYQAWLEALPAPSQPVPLRVRPGDTVSVTVEEIAEDLWRIEMKNDTTGRTYAAQMFYESSRSSAEWVEEAPSTWAGRVIPLNDFGTTLFTSGSATADGKEIALSGSGADAMHMINRRGGVLAVTSILNDDGSFTVSRTSTPSLSRVTYQELFLAPPRGSGTR